MYWSVVVLNANWLYFLFWFPPLLYLLFASRFPLSSSLSHSLSLTLSLSLSLSPSLSPSAAACLACGNFISYFPAECRSYLEELFPLFLANLEDSIPSVRQGGAATIASVVKAYGT